MEGGSFSFLIYTGTEDSGVPGLALVPGSEGAESSPSRILQTGGRHEQASRYLLFDRFIEVF